MNWDAIATTKVNDLTRTRSSGRPVNTHVVQSRVSAGPDYERMKKLVHDSDSSKKDDTPPRRVSEK